MLTAVVGGKLQGVEATYLAQKAGWDVLLLDKITDVPASGFCNSFVQIDVRQKEDLRRIIKRADFIIPALENNDAIRALVQEADSAGIPIAFDCNSYGVSSSKIESNRVFSHIGASIPRPWPECGFPIVAKPSKSSGSEGVHVFRSEDDIKAFEMPDFGGDSWVIQEFVRGPSYSLEVLGMDGRYLPLQVTDLHMDAYYDCKRVTAPASLPRGLSSTFEKISVNIARTLNLKGIIDVEAILNDGKLKVLEIDARLPSQTPTTVFWSTGLNMVKMLGNIFMNHNSLLPELKKTTGVVYEHIAVSPGLLEIAGEHIMTGSGPLKVVRDFFGADEAITSYAEGRDHWVATLITEEDELLGAEEKITAVIETIRKRFRIERIVDSTPELA